MSKFHENRVINRLPMKAATPPENIPIAALVKKPKLFSSLLKIIKFLNAQGFNLILIEN
jgi:hypothetical protein